MGSKKDIILFENDDYLIVNKPAGELVIPDRFSDERSLQVKLMHQYGKLYVVHRLDRDTSGALCFARNEAAHKHLSELFFNHQVDKRYLAITENIPTPHEGLIDIGIRESQTRRGCMVTHIKGKPSQTKYKLKESFGSLALLEIELLTGRTHQIRVHLRHIACPLLVDNKYGNREAFLLSSIKGRKYHFGKNKEERPILSRQSLHASTIEFKDSKGLTIRIEAPLPKDFAATLNQLRKIKKN